MKKQRIEFNPITGKQIDPIPNVLLTNVQDSQRKKRYSPVPPLDLSALKESDDDNDPVSPPFIEVKVNTPSSSFSMGTPIGDKKNMVDKRDGQIKSERMKEDKIKTVEFVKDETDEMLENMMKEWNNPPYSKIELKRLTDKIELEEKNKELRLLETMMTDQLHRLNISSIAHHKRASGLSQSTKLIRMTPASSEGALSQLVKFETRMFTDVGKDAIRELTGFYFAFDGSITIYEYKNFGKMSKSLPFVKRDIYQHLRGPRAQERYTLTDILQEGELEFKTNGQPLPATLLQQSSIKFIIVEVDIAAKKKILLQGIDVFLHNKVWNDLHSPKNKTEERFLKMQHKMQAAMKEQLKDKGIKVFMRIGCAFRNRCNITDGNNELDIYEMEKELINHGIKIPRSKFEDLMDILDSESKSFMPYTMFMRSIIGEMVEHRKKLVKKAFIKIDYNKVGCVTLSDIFKYFNGAKHPWVISGTHKATDIFEEFKSAFISNGEASSISYRCFEEFYEGLSCVVDIDDDFENILRNTWGI